MFPYYLSLGMTYDLYWHGDNTLVCAYDRAQEITNKRRNQELWLQGLYDFHAVSIALSNFHLDGKRHEVNKYLDKPFDIYGKTKSQEEHDAEVARQAIIDNLNRWKEKWDSKKG